MNPMAPAPSEAGIEVDFIGSIKLDAPRSLTLGLHQADDEHIAR